MSSKLREALKKCMELGKNIDESLGNDESTVWNCRHERSSANSIVEIAKSALAEPLRNCEVGTAEEQIERYKNFCKTYSSCRRCPCQKNNDIITAKCFANWSQMPYEGKMKE